MEQRLCLGLGAVDRPDPILKERMFGLAGPQGNHGEDVKDYWWYLDGTPTHSWHTWRYHYPQVPFPYDDLVTENGRRSRTQPEYELVDTGVFDEDRYWVVTVDYAKGGPHDLLMRITIENAGPTEATISVLPTLTYRNTWSWGYPTATQPDLRLEGSRVVGLHSRSGALAMAGDGAGVPLFCDNETNTQRLYGAEQGSRPTPRTASTTTWSTAPTLSTRNTTGRKLPCTTREPCRGAAVRRSRCGWLAAARRGRRAPYDGGAIGRAPGGRPPGGQQNGGVSAPGFDAVIDERRKAEADAFYAAHHASDVRPGRGTGAAPGLSPACSGRSSSSTTT